MSAPPETFIRKTIRPLAAYGPPRDPAAVPLHLNESPSDVPEDLKRALVERLFRSDWSKYPITDGARLSRSLAAVAGVDPAGTMVGNGSNELLKRHPVRPSRVHSLVGDSVRGAQADVREVIDVDWLH